MDLSKVTSITIPEGVVYQIKDSSGNILWKKPTVKTVRRRKSDNETTVKDDNNG